MKVISIGGEMTIKKYLENPYIHKFTSKVMEVLEYNNKTAIILDETYFYPEGGGQPNDIGTIENQIISDVQIEDGVIYHITNSDIKALSALKLKVVNCEINFQRRLHLMQQHAGQHMLSATAYKIFNANTVGFHIGDDYITIDLDQKLSATDVEMLEIEANRAVQANTEILAHYPSEAELQNMPLRKTPKVTKDIRVIEISDLDFSPCGGTHPKFTGEIGLIKIKRFENYKSGIRITFSCGLDAVKYGIDMQNALNNIMKLLARPENELPQGVEALLQKQKDDRKSIEALELELVKFEIEKTMMAFEPINGPHLITLTYDQFTFERIRMLATEWIKLDDVAVILQSNSAEGAQIVIAISNNLKDTVKLKAIFDAHKTAFDVRGGGSPTMIQAKSTDFEQMALFLECVENDIRNDLMTL